MSLSDLAALGSFISGFAVLVSLIFLYFQLRQVNAQVLQTETNQRALMNQGAITRSVEIAEWSTNPTISALVSRVFNGEQDFSHQELFQLSQFLRILVVAAQDAYVQHGAGLIDQITLDNSMGGLMRAFQNPVYRALWKSLRIVLAPDWTSYIDRLIEEMPISKPVDRLDQFKADLAEVLR